MVVHLEMYNPATGETETVNSVDAHHMKGKLWNRDLDPAEEMEVMDAVIDAVQLHNASVRAALSTTPSHER